MKKIAATILDAIGDTPMVRINRITRAVVPGTVLAKVETFNPGNSIKDRMAVKMIEDAERAGTLKPGGTIIEGTSGNTGMGLAIAAVVKGYKCIFTTTDKQSKEKIDALKAFGAEVIVCPYAVEPESPESYYSVSDRLAEEIPGAFKPDQYRNEGNPRSHYETTGPEIWEQTGGALEALVIAVGKDFDAIPEQFRKLQRETNIATAKNFGVKEPEAIIDYYEKNVDKWRVRSKEIGRDIDKFAKVIEDEIFAKVDLSKL